ncbi:MAG TPA: ATP-dependent DNA ligase [Herpetosiphonaceae bacterium]|nr:ATP-dependent DNA ligase [Herpetosiphonaceae bacterium]
MLFHQFAELADRLSQTSGKLDKSARIGEYLAGLRDQDLLLATRYLAGAPFALHDERVLNVGFAQIREAVVAIAGITPHDWDELTVAHGDPGDAAAVALAGALPQAASLTLAEVQAALERIGAARGPKEKVPALVGLLRSATPPEARYILKLLSGELRIGVREGQIEDALHRAFDQPLASVRRANMLLGDIGETALRARAGTLETAEMRLFHPLKSMLASPIEEPEEIRRSIAGQFFVEDKYDGIRAQAHRTGARVELFSRTLDAVTHRFPEVTAALAGLPHDVILDGEILAARDGTILPFAALQKRLGRKTVGAELLAETPVIYIIYDLLYLDGRVLLEAPLSERRAALEALPWSGPLQPSLLAREDDLAAIDGHFGAARARGNEGLMIKDPRSAYAPGRRGREWLKVKRALATLDVVVTAAEVGHGKRRNVLSDYTFAVRRSAEDGALLNIGKAYSGLTDAEIAELTEWFKAHTTQRYGRVHLVEPQIVLEVAFDAVQASPRHKSGYALRFPRIVRLRPDKPPREIDTLDAVRALAEGG